MAKVVVLNGPPGCGKDTIAQHLVRYYNNYKSVSLKEPLFRIAAGILGPHKFKMFMNNYDTRERKEVPMNILNGLSPRQFMIWISEDVIKPMFGENYFANELVDTIREFRHSETIIVTDCGFRNELETIVSYGHNVVLFRLRREGFSFDGDSRSYIYMQNWNNGRYKCKAADLQLDEGEPHLAAAYINKVMEMV